MKSSWFPTVVRETLVAVPLAVMTLGAALTACGGEATPESKTAEVVDGAASPAVPADADREPPREADATKPQTGQGAADSAKLAPEAPTKDEGSAREVKYVLTPEGLKVEVAGVRFLASAQSKQIGQGWGVKVTVKAEVTDGKPHVLLSPKNGPMAFAAAVFKKGSTEAERIADAREGDGEQRLSPDSPGSFSRDFPAKGGRVLGMGEKLDMEVALWGLGETSEDRRPLKQFFHVKMQVEKGKPKVVVEPPASAAK